MTRKKTELEEYYQIRKDRFHAGKMWRPEGKEWEEERRRRIAIIINTVNTEAVDHINIYEAGADAILEEILKLG